MQKLFLFLIVISTTSHGAVRSTSKLQDKISNQTNQISLIAAQIQSLEKRINTSNNTYLEKISKIEEAENKIKLMKDNLSKTAVKISSEFNIAKVALQRYLIEARDESTDESLVKKVFFKKILKEKILKLSKAQLASKNLLKSTNRYEQKLVKIKKSESDMYDLIVSLENNKKQYSQKYVTLLEAKNENQDSLDRVKAKLRAKRKKSKKISPRKIVKFKKKLKINFSLPLNDFVDAKIDKKTISLRFTDVQPVTSPAAGKVAYAGELASYGKVIVIDHGNDLRSVLLGDVNIRVKKGDFVNEATILGYTLPEAGLRKNLFFEVRKKNVAQDTLSWLSRNNKNKLKI